MENKRNAIIDWYKGILMYGVILGHTITALKGGLDVGPIFIHTFLRTYDMPFFMILSGFFLQRSLIKHNIKYVLANRVTMILFPILLWNMISFNYHFSSFYFLWAVFVSSFVCITSYEIEKKIRVGGRLHIELFLELSFAIALYFVELPWNLFYLYPFFIFGRHLKNIDFKLSNFLCVFFSFVFLLCFWKGAYSPWTMGADAWKCDEMNVLVYIYRFILGVVGTFVVANILKYAFVINWGGKRVLIKAGSQTLATYILQSIIVEKYFGKIMKIMVNYFDIKYTDSFLNIIGYVIAPVFSFIVLMVLSLIIDRLNNYKYTKVLFGTKITL